MNFSCSAQFILSGHLPVYHFCNHKLDKINFIVPQFVLGSSPMLQSPLKHPSPFKTQTTITPVIVNVLNAPIIIRHTVAVESYCLWKKGVFESVQSKIQTKVKENSTQMCHYVIQPCKKKVTLLCRGKLLFFILAYRGVFAQLTEGGEGFLVGFPNLLYDVL